MRLLFFASLREQLSTDKEDWPDLDNIITIHDVKLKLIERGEPWSSALANPRLIVSINQEVASMNDKVSLHDELAFYPPVTGG